MEEEPFEKVEQLFDLRLKNLRGLESINSSKGGSVPFVGVKKRLNRVESQRYLEALGLLSHAHKILSEKAFSSELALSLFSETHKNSHLTSLTLENFQMTGCAFEESSFRNSDVRKAKISRCDFIDVDFSRTLMCNSNLQDCSFGLCVFYRSDLSGADLTASRFQECDFSAAKMFGTRIDVQMQDQLVLSDLQKAVIDWVGN